MATNTSAYHCIVCTLTKIPFATLSKESQQKIVKSGRPTNQMPILHARCQSSSNLNAFPWITGCEKNQRLYCWPCLLFSKSEYDTWGRRGFTDFHRLSQAIPEHLKDVSHQAKSTTLKLWMETSSDVSDDSSEEELECIPELDFLNSNVSEEEEELDIKPNVEALNASSSSSSQQAVTAILDLCDPAGVKEIEVSRSSPIVIRDSSPVPSTSSNVELFTATATAFTTTSATTSTQITVAASQEEEIAKIYRETVDMSQPAVGAEKYQLKWHSHQQNLNSSISCLYRNDRYADVMLITCNNDESFSMAAHKLVLGTSSTYFANIFDKTVTPPNAMTYIVLPPELTRRALQTLIQYMYTGESTVSVDILNEVLRGGEILKIRGLWRNPGISDGTASTEQTTSKGRHRSERVSVDRVLLQEPRVAQNPVTIHDSPVIVTNAAKSYGISQTAQMPASSSTPIINVKKDVAIDPGERCRSSSNIDGNPSSTKRSHPAINQENNHQTPKQQPITKNSPSRAVLTNTENVPPTHSVSQTMPEELNFLNVKEEPVEWSDVNAGEIDLDKTGLPIVKVEMKDPVCSDESEDHSQEQVYSPLTCELCSETFTVPAEWVRHIESHTDPPHTASKRRRRLESDNNADMTAALKCDLCAMYFVTPAEWVRHVQNTHTETELAMSNNSTLSRRGTKISSSNTLTTSVQQAQERICSVCNKGFPSYASMIIHKRTHTGMGSSG
ncbi:myoneurin isoform X1 [Malaya genurostris]|uniref:myoneurin isoform X1 n=1 Tax=Malaya genurostris TaxID=325434 RepID=UPI0026F39B97|nr:myoneurin isoform X1 [Malaya genurostris]XP_058456171.1 myoneurin isoform X1 [Malaya genurostris]XP_058456172.1 myoneurin isoform X1 [Malaya genurostris]